MPTNLPVGSVPCRCGEYSWLPECSPDMREGVISGVFHSPAQCFKLDAEPPAPDAEPSEKYSLKAVDALTHQWFIDRTNRAIADLLGPPPDVAKILRTYKPEYLNRIGFTATEPCLDYAHAQEELRLVEQHAALRWERVARRWKAKRPIRCCCGESELDSFGDSRMFRHGTRKWKRHTLKRCDCDIVNPMCRCGEWLFDANYHVAYGVPFAHFAVDVRHTPEGCHPTVPP